MPAQLRFGPDGIGSRRNAIRLGLTFSGLLLISVRWAADTQADLQARIQHLQHEVVEAHRIMPRAACNAQHAMTLQNPVGDAGDDRLGASTRNGSRGAESPTDRLVKHAPSGFDACARMESADALVISTLGE